MRQVILDTETTGLDLQSGNRLIEIGCVEIVDRKFTGREFHTFLNPERAVEPGAFKVHGVSNDFLADKPFFKDIIDNEYVLDVGLGITIFIIVIFLILLINKGISKAIKYTGLGSLDTVFGFFFGFIRAYIISICIFSGVHIVYNYDKWPINLNKSYTFPYLEKGSNYLLKVFPNEKTYKDSKEKIEDL